MRKKKLISLVVFATAFALLFNKAYLNFDHDHPMLSLLAFLLLLGAAFFGIIYGSKEDVVKTPEH